MFKRIFSILLYAFLYPAATIVAQPDCITSYGVVYGTPDGNELGHTLAATPDHTGFYIGGVKDDSVLLVRMNLTGEVLWSRTMDIIPGETDNIGCLIVDSDENLVFGGIAGQQGSGGTIFFCKYNPSSDQILWTNEYVNAWTRSYFYDIIEKGSGGNYLVSNNPHDDQNSNNDAEILELSRSTGTVVSGGSTMYSFGSSEQLSEFVLHSGSLYGVGRYTDGPSAADMRHTLTRINPVNFSPVWTRMGHVAGNATARLYGQDMFIEANELYSSYYGDPAGTSTANTKVYIQKNDLSGTLLWLKQYELSGNNDYTVEMIASSGGIVMLAQKRSVPRELILFKTDFSGNMLWANQFQFPTLSNVDINLFGQHQLIEVGGYLMFTGSGVSAGGAEMIVVRASLEGEVDLPCVNTQDISIAVQTLSSPVFYAITPTVLNPSFTEDDPAPDIVEAFIGPNDECILTDTILELVEAFICPGETYEGYSVPGTYVDYFTTAEGCDSARTLELGLLSTSATFEQVEICLGQSYEGHAETGVYVETYQNILGCDSVHTLELLVIPLEQNQFVEICEGQSYAGYTVSGFYVDTLQGPPNDCDTIRFLLLDVQPADQTQITATICEGEAYEGYTVSGQYIDTFTNGEGCDSVRTLFLNVATEHETNESVEICLGETYAGHAASGTYVDTFQNSFGCDSIHTLVLLVTALPSDISAEICEGEQYAGYTETGFYTDTLQGLPNECDTIRQLDLIVHPIDNTEFDVSICEGDSYEGYTISGIYVDQFINGHGCDSIRTLQLTVTDVIMTSFDITICPGQTYEGYAVPGIYSDQFISIFGCDSIRTLNLFVGLLSTDLQVQICSGGTFEGYSQSGTYLDTLQGAGGNCDTIRHLTLVVQPPLLTFINASICESQMFLGYEETGFYTDTFQSIDNCDSVRQLQLTVTDQFVLTIQKTICEGESYEGYFASGSYTDTFQTSFGCDSIRVLMLSVEVCQSDCSYNVDNVLGDPLVDEQGLCLAGSAFSPAVYIAGTRGNNTLLVKMDYTGKAIWSREFDMAPGGVEVPGGLIEDSEGMLVVAGTGNDIAQGGTLYAFRYDPEANVVMWAQEYTVTPNENCFGLIEKGPGGNYILNNSVNRLDLNHNYAGVFEIDRATGDPVLAFAKNYQIIGTETLFELTWHNGALYGVGRYKDGGINQKMRNTLTQLDPADGDQLWVKMGHRSVNQDARLYGTDLVIADGSIFSIYSGDPSGVSTTNTKLYVQRTDLNGNLIWLNQYELPGNNDNTIDLTATTNGLIVLSYEAVADLYYFYKIDFNGDMVWANTFVFNGIQSAVDPVFSNRQLISAGNQLFFVGYGINATSDRDMIIVITDADGNISNGCIESVPVNIEVNVVADITWYDKQVIQFDVTPENTPQPVTPIDLTLTSSLACMSDTLHSEIAVTICQGQSYDNYSEQGIYQDTFLTALGCDSIRTLDLSVEFLAADTIVQICNGDDFEGYTQTGMYVDTLQGVSGNCDTIRHLTLFVQPPLLTGINAVICEGGTFLGYDSAGTYVDTFQTSIGCDSVRILNLSLSDILYSSSMIWICLGEAYEGYTTTGIYIDTFQTVAGCDSVRELMLEVEILQKQIHVEVCSGQSFDQYTQTGIYLDTLQGMPGMCDTSRELHLTVEPAIFASVEQTICAGDRYAGYYESGIYFDTLVTPSGCDSIRELHLETIDAVSSIIHASACDPNSSYNLPPGEYRDTLIAISGCDSIRTLQLEGSTLFIPNVFSPNNDGINDVFTLTVFPVMDIDLDYFAIFDRFGDMVYETSGWPVEWKGTDQKGELFHPGVFAYILIYQCGTRRNSQHGDITLVR